MDIDSIRQYCLSFPNATEKLQWGDNLCFKVKGKIFTILGLDELRVCFKATPESFAELIEREDIHPAPYLGRYQWLMLDRLDVLGDREFKELVRQSYEMVFAKLPKKAAMQQDRKARDKARRKRAA